MASHGAYYRYLAGNNLNDMAQRRKMAAANWKMNLSLEEGRQLARAVLHDLPQPLDCEVVIAPPFTHLAVLGQVIGGTVIRTGAQNCHPASSGAFTGEVSLAMLAECAVTHVIIGHSERRQIFNETNAFVKDKLDAILAAGMTPIFCCGEPLAEREAGEAAGFVYRQMIDGLFHLSPAQMREVVIAYEPIWAIGTGKTASPEQAQEMHAFIRKSMARHFDPDTAEAVRILYGGSIKADNARDLFSQPDIDGGLVGGASLDAASFCAIIEAACG
jgi:triosephosphate isomerase